VHPPPSRRITSGTRPGRGVAVVVGFLLPPHGAGHTGGRVEQPRLLDDCAAIFDDLDLALDLVLDGLLYEAEGVDVLGLGAGAERSEPTA